MKKVVLFICFVVALAMADNTIDLSSAPLSHEVQKPKSNWIGEIGIGYIVPHLKAKQKAADIDATAFMHGIDIFMALNKYITERFGFSFGTGAEFTIGKFKDEFYECTYDAAGTLYTPIPGTMWSKRETSYTRNDFICNKNASNWQLANWYFYIGIFGDILEFEKVTIRAFTNIGYSFNWLVASGNFQNRMSCWEGKVAFGCSTYKDDDMRPAAELIPISLGLRFIFAKNHGIELVGKYYYNAHDIDKQKGEWHYTQNLPIVVKTEISRDYSFGIRYVYEFKD